MKKVMVLAVGVLLLAVAAAGTGSAAPAKPLKVGMVTDVGGLNDHGFNHLAYVGLQQAQKQLGITFQVAASRAPADYIPNLAAFAGRATTSCSGSATPRSTRWGPSPSASPRRSSRSSTSPTATWPASRRTSSGCSSARSRSATSPATSAGLEAKRLPGRDVVSSVAGQKQPPVDRFIAGYQAGAKKAFPKVITVNAYSQDFNDQAKCKAIAENQIAAGSIAVFAVAGGCGLGALEAARERDVWGIGVDADQSFLGPHILTSATKKVDRAVFLAVKSVQDGTFHGGDAVYGLAQGGVGLGKISAKVPRSEIAAVKRIKAQLTAGTIVPPGSSS